MLKLLFQRLRDHALQQPQQIALRDAEQVLTYAQLISRVSALSLQYQQSAHQRFALALDNSVEWILHDLALLHANKVVVPLPSFFTPQQCEAVLTDAGVTQVLERQTSGGAISYRSRTVSQAPELPRGTCKITYTSGSTGSPKGVCLGAEHLLRTVMALSQRLGSVTVTRHLVLLPLAVLLENIAGVYLSLWLGHEVRLAAVNELGLQGASSLDVPRFFSALKVLQPQSLILTPALAQAIIRGVEQGALDTEQFKLLAVGGAYLSAGLEHRAHAAGLPLVQGYGLSEFGSVVSFNDPQQPVAGTVGKPLPHATVELVDNEIIVSGNVMLGYLNDPTSWYQHRFATGDYGAWAPTGELCLRGRKKHTIVTAYGRNVDPEWLETELTQYSAIAQCAVVGAEDIALTALIFASPALDAAECEQVISDIIQRVNQRLPAYANIRAWHLLDTPFTVANYLLTGTGRLRRAAIAATYSQLFNTKEPDHGILSTTV
ncbi:AMP-binding protein [Pseudidiomarina salilacus]|uniref:AMP-binding protein n=1 Tax=Pseudidiomarina salilacus TaxID=3384452 RepID=UPI003984733E